MDGLIEQGELSGAVPLGGGFAGVAGIACLLVGMVGTFVSGDLDSAAGQQSLWTGLATTLGSLITAVAGIWMITKHLDSIPLLNRIVLRTEVGDTVIPRSTAAATVLGAMGDRPTDPLAEGAIGVAVTDLRPAGRARFGEHLTDVQSVSGFVDPGTPVRIVARTSFAIEVEAAPDADPSALSDSGESA